MTFWIADLCSNHNQNLTRTLKLIDKAKYAGCWGIKIQLFTADKLFAPGFNKQRKKMKKWEFPYKFLNEVSKYCRDIDIQFGATPFDLMSVNTLKQSGVDFLKIGSYENHWDELIKKVVDTGKPWQISAGMMELINIRQFTQQKYIKKNPPMALYLCNSTYPAKPEECNLNDIKFCKTYINDYNNKIGWSDHTGEPGVIYQAVNNGVEYIEFHLDVEDKKGYESEIGHCWVPSEIKKVIHDVEVMQKSEFSNNKNYNKEAKKWRTDSDGFRPLKEFREELK